MNKEYLEELRHKVKYLSVGNSTLKTTQQVLTDLVKIVEDQNYKIDLLEKRIEDLTPFPQHQELC